MVGSQTALKAIWASLLKQPPDTAHIIKGADGMALSGGYQRCQVPHETIGTWTTKIARLPVSGGWHALVYTKQAEFGFEKDSFLLLAQSDEEAPALHHRFLDKRSIARSVHEARRLRQSGDLEGALAVFAGVDAAGAATTKEARWAYAEWTDLVRRRSGDGNVLVYSQGTGRAAALVPRDDGSLEVAAVLGMRWEPGKLVSRRSLRGLKPLKGGASWS